MYLNTKKKYSRRKIYYLHYKLIEKQIFRDLKQIPGRTYKSWARTLKLTRLENFQTSLPEIKKKKKIH